MFKVIFKNYFLILKNKSCKYGNQLKCWGHFAPYDQHKILRRCDHGRLKSVTQSLRHPTYVIQIIYKYLSMNFHFLVVRLYEVAVSF